MTSTINQRRAAGRQPAARPTASPGNRRAQGDMWIGWLLTLPALILVIGIIVLPLLASIVVSFSNYSLTRPTWSWLGLENYLDLLGGDGNSAGTFLAALRHSFFFSFVSITIEFILGFGLALLLNRIVRISGLLRTLLVLPIMIAPTVSALQWRWILDPDNGIFNYLAQAVGLLDGPQLWLIRPNAAIWTVILVDVWQTTPFVLLFLLAGLKSLPQEPYEAAQVDGASAWQLFWHLTLPLLRPIILAVLLLRFMDAFRIFDIVYVLTRGGPAFATDMVSLYTYRAGLQWFEIGKASAAGVLTLLVIAICAALLLTLLGPGRNREET